MEEKKDDFRHILRVAGTDLSGGGKMINELRKIKGVSFMFANVICCVTKLDPNQKMGYVEEGTIAKIEEVLKNPTKHNIPVWMFNRKNDPEDGEEAAEARHHIPAASHTRGGPRRPRQNSPLIRR